MYHTGEFIVYGTSGVCEVTAVGQPAFARDEGRLYYTLTPVYGTETIYIPVDSPAVHASGHFQGAGRSADSNPFPRY